MPTLRYWIAGLVIAFSAGLPAPVPAKKALALMKRSLREVSRLSQRCLVAKKRRSGFLGPVRLDR
jgi:hypothetical protein